MKIIKNLHEKAERRRPKTRVAYVPPKSGSSPFNAKGWTTGSALCSHFCAEALLGQFGGCSAVLVDLLIGQGTVCSAELQLES